MIELHPDEESLLEVRRYWLSITVRAIGFLCAGILPLVVLIGADSYPSAFADAIRPYSTHAYLLAVVWFLMAWVGIGVAWVDYYLDIFIITTKRIVDIEQLGLFSRSTAEMPIENIEDIHVDVNGFLASALDFGNLSIQSAGESREFNIENIHHPSRVKDLISQQYDAFLNLRVGNREVRKK